MNSTPAGAESLTPPPAGSAPKATQEARPLSPIQSQTIAPVIEEKAPPPPSDKQGKKKGGEAVTTVRAPAQSLEKPPSKKGDEKPAAAKGEAKPKKTNDYAFYLKAGDRSPKWNELIEPAFTSFDSGHYPTASVFLKKAYERGCRDGLVLYRLGIYQELQKQYKEAADLLAEASEKIPRQYPSHPLAKGIHHHAARALYQVDDYARALPALKKALEYDSENFMLLFMAGQLLRLGKNYEDARSAFEQALRAKPPEGLELDPKQRIWRELMTISYELKDFEACAAYAEMILAANPNDSIALSYKQNIDRQRFRQKEREVLEKIVQ